MLFFKTLCIIFALMSAVQSQYNHQASSYTNTTWMKFLDDGIPIRKLSILGTHSSMGTGVWGDAFQTQANPLYNQMQMGVRALDIRCRHYRDGFSIHDRLAYLNKDFEDVVPEVDSFLATYSHETILMHIVEQYNPYDNKRTFQQTLISYINTFSNFWKPTSQNPTLGEVRGKIVIIQNFKSVGVHGLLASTFKFLNHRQLTTNWDLYDKWLQVKTSLINNNKAGQSAISFWTGNHGSFPYFVASGKSSPGNSHPRLSTALTTPGFKSYYPDFPRVWCVWIFVEICTIAFEGINILGYNYMQNNNLNFVGIIFTDFAGDNLIQKTLLRNSNRFPSCPLNSINQGCTYCNSLSQCLGCKTIQKYVYEASSFSCLAAKGYYLNWTTPTSNSPAPCTSAILGCLQCLSATQCTLCSPVQNYQLSNSTCIAAPGYYLDSEGIPIVCRIVGCYICQSENICIQCSTKNNFIMASNQTCVCNTSANFRLLWDACACVDGYFLNANQTCQSMPLCPQNNSGCLECNVGPPNSCAVCDTNNSFSFAQFDSAYCTCIASYYYNGQTCESCNLTLTEACLSCLSSELCIQCQSNFTLFNGGCSCRPPFYLLDAATCYPCDIGCLQCESSAVCQICDDQNNFTLIDSICECKIGMFLSSNTSCELCGSMPGCLDCNSQGCISCDAILGFALNLTAEECQCSDGYFINNNSVCQACSQLGCINCLEEALCIECDNSTFYLQGESCSEICGDGRLFILECDDNNIIDGDGCSSSCTVESGYTCMGGTNDNPSACSYSGPISIVTTTYQKDPTSNTVYLTASFYPNLPIISLLDFNQVFIPNFPVAASETIFDNTTGTLYMRFDYNESLNDMQLSVDFKAPETPNYFKMPRVSVALPQTTDNNLALKLYSDDEYSLIDKIQTIFTVLSIASVVTFFLCFFFCSKLIAVEFILIYQLSFASLMLLKKLELYMSPVGILRISNGYNELINSKDMPLPGQYQALYFHSDFLENFNFSFVVVLLPLIVGLILSVIGRIKSKGIKIMGYRILKQWLLSAFLFVQVQLIVSFVLQIYYNGTTAVNMTLASCLQIMALALMVTFIKWPKNFGQYKEYFNEDATSQSWYLLTFCYRTISTVLLACLGEVAWGIYAIVGLSVLYAIVLGVKRPYKSNTRPISNSIFLTIVLAMISICKIYQDSSNSNFISKYVAFFIIAILYLVLIVHIIWIILRIRQACKPKIQEIPDQKDIEFEAMFMNDIKEKLKRPLCIHVFENEDERQQSNRSLLSQIITRLEASKIQEASKIEESLVDQCEASHQAKQQQQQSQRSQNVNTSSI